MKQAFLTGRIDTAEGVDTTHGNRAFLGGASPRPRWQRRLCSLSPKSVSDWTNFSTVGLSRFVSCFSTGPACETMAVFHLIMQLFNAARSRGMSGSCLIASGLTTSISSRATAGDIQISATFSFAGESKRPPVMTLAALYDTLFSMR